jgi:hypothetical protein
LLTGIETRTEFGALLLLLVGNAVALVVGHSHRR